MDPTITCGTHFANHCNIAGSRFEDVNLGEASFDDVNLAKATFHNINLSDINISAAQWGGATFQCIGLPPIPECEGQKQRPLSFTNCDINASTFSKCDLSNVTLEDCNVEGMSINGVAVSAMIEAYNAQNR